MVVKIENFEGTSDTFVFPYNPMVFDNTLDTNKDITHKGFQRHHILVSGAGINPSGIVLTGHFSGSDRWTNYRNLAKHFVQNDKLKKLFFEDDKFYLGVGSQLKKTHTGERTNFIDYVFTFTTLVGVLFGDTLKTSGTNEGNTDTYVFEITGTIANGGANVELEDDFGNVIRVDSSAFSTDDDFKFELVKMIDSGSGISVSEYGIVSINGTQVRQVSTMGGFGLLKIRSGDNVSTISTSNLNSVSVKFRDGYAD